MGQRYLIDSNVIIDFCNGRLSEKGRILLQYLEPEISIITHIELFGTKNISPAEYELLRRFVDISVVHPINTDLVDTTIQIRQAHRLKLPDALIAATALKLQLVLLSRNISDFNKVTGLHVIDPAAS